MAMALASCHCMPSFLGTSLGQSRSTLGGWQSQCALDAPPTDLEDLVGNISV